MISTASLNRMELWHCWEYHWFMNWSKFTATQLEPCETISQLFNHNKALHVLSVLSDLLQPEVAFTHQYTARQAVWRGVLWLFPFSPLFCVIFSPRELPGNPLWPCTNSSLHDTIEQSRHLASELPPPCPLYPPPVQPPSTMASRTMGGIEVLGAAQALTHTHTHRSCCHRR